MGGGKAGTLVMADVLFAVFPSALPISGAMKLNPFADQTCVVFTHHSGI